MGGRRSDLPRRLYCDPPARRVTTRYCDRPLDPCLTVGEIRGENLTSEAWLLSSGGDMANVTVRHEPQRERTEPNGTLARVRGAWRSSPRATHVLVSTGVVLALGATSQERVPLASGIAVAIMMIGALVDVAERRIPNSVTLAAVIGLVLCCLGSAAIGSDVDAGSALIGAGMMAAPLIVVHVGSPEAMGLGDVKAAIVLGAAAGLVHWQLPLVALASAAAATAAVGLARRQRLIAFGPGLVGGTVLALVLADLIVPGRGVPVMVEVIGG